MTALTPDRARELLGGRVTRHGVLNGHDLLAGHATRGGMTLITRERRGWSWYQRDRRRGREKQAVRPGSRLIGAGAVMLTGLGIGLLAVSYAAQYRYVLNERHQGVASAIEAGALDVGLIIFSLLALGLARAGLAARVERGLIVACAAGSALMNFAPAEASSWRSVLAYCMPPAFLAVVVDRVVVVVRRHVLGMRDGRSPWSAAVTALGRAARFASLAVLYGLRLVLAPASTCAGIRRAILAAVPLPEAPVLPQAEAPDDPIACCPALVDAGPVRLPCRKAMPCAVHPQDNPEWVATHCLVMCGKDVFCAKPLPCPTHDPAPRRDRRPGRAGGTKTARFLELVRTRHGDLEAIPLSQVSKIATAIAPDADLHPASARTALLGAVRAALPAGGGDAR